MCVCVCHRWCIYGNSLAWFQIHWILFTSKSSKSSNVNIIVPKYAKSMPNLSSVEPLDTYIKIDRPKTHRLHGAAIYGNMDPIKKYPLYVSINIPAPWIRHGKVSKKSPRFPDHQRVSMSWCDISSEGLVAASQKCVLKRRARWHKMWAPYGCVWKCCVPHCAQWFCWSLSLLNGYFIGNIPKK